MNSKPPTASQPGPDSAVTELLVLPDGRILAHNLTASVAAVLAELDPADAAMRQRAQALAGEGPGHRKRSVGEAPPAGKSDS